MNLRRVLPLRGLNPNNNNKYSRKRQSPGSNLLRVQPKEEAQSAKIEVGCGHWQVSAFTKLSEVTSASLSLFKGDLHTCVVITMPVALY